MSVTWTPEFAIDSQPLGTQGQGPPGARGQDGATWIQGKGPPSVNQGNVGDFFFNAKTADVFQKQVAYFGIPPTWILLVNLKGLQGAPGQPGAAGPPGVGSPGPKGQDGATGTPGTPG